LGTILAIAAALKLHLLLTDPFADIHLQFPLSIIWFAILTEFLIAYVAFFSEDRVFASLLLSLFFTALAILNATRWLGGNYNCGCFGMVEVPIWFTFCFTVTCVCTLFFFAPTRVCVQVIFATLSDSWRRSALQCASVLICTWLFVGAPFIHSKSVLALIVRTDSQVFASAAEAVVPAELKLAQVSDFVIELRNPLDVGAQIVGTMKSCSCISVPAVNGEINPHGTVKLSGTLSPTVSGSFHQRVVFYVTSIGRDNRLHRINCDLRSFVK
jgi:hypothetical protein